MVLMVAGSLTLVSFDSLKQPLPIPETVQSFSDQLIVAGMSSSLISRGASAISTVLSEYEEMRYLHPSFSKSYLAFSLPVMSLSYSSSRLWLPSRRMLLRLVHPMKALLLTCLMLAGSSISSNCSQAPNAPASIRSRPSSNVTFFRFTHL